MLPYEDSKTVSVCPAVCPSVPYFEKRNQPGFVNISPTLVIDTPMEKSARVLHHGNPFFFFFFKFEIDKIEFYPYPECPYPEKKNRLLM